MTKRTKTGKLPELLPRKNEDKIDTSTGKYYLENKLVKKLNIKGEVI